MKALARKSDFLFMGLVALLVGFGLVMLMSATGPFAFQKFSDSYWFLKHQVFFGVLPGLVAFMVLSRIDYRYWKKYEKAFLGVSVFLLLLVFIPGLAATWGTSKSWIAIGGFSFQPAEVVKLTFLLYLAAWFSRLDIKKIHSVNDGLVPFLGAFGVVAVLMLLQPDLGTLLVVGAMAFAIYVVAGAKWSHLGALVGMAVIGLMVMIAVAPYRVARITTFLYPENDPKGIGYHINQAYIAIGSGGFFGLGLGHSRQKYLYLPEVAGDSIFAVAAEELGFFVMLAFIACIALFLFRGYSIGQHTGDAFGRYIVVGIMTWIFAQMVFNIGSMVGLFPITGLPLPFISYGGTSLMVLLAAMGLMVSVSKHS
jgi:cell division protein FtsW